MLFCDVPLSQCILTAGASALFEFGRSVPSQDISSRPCHVLRVGRRGSAPVERVLQSEWGCNPYSINLGCASEPKQCERPQQHIACAAHQSTIPGPKSNDSSALRKKHELGTDAEARFRKPERNLVAAAGTRLGLAKFLKSGPSIL